MSFLKNLYRFPAWGYLLVLAVIIGLGIFPVIGGYTGYIQIAFGVVLVGVVIIQVAIKRQLGGIKPRKGYPILASIMAMISSGGSIWGASFIGFDNYVARIGFALVISLGFYFSIHLIVTGNKKVGIILFLINILTLSTFTNISVLSQDSIKGQRDQIFHKRAIAYVEKISTNWQNLSSQYKSEKGGLFNQVSGTLLAEAEGEAAGEKSGKAGRGQTYKSIMSTKTKVDEEIRPRVMDKISYWRNKSILLSNPQQAKYNLQDERGMKIVSMYNELVHKMHSGMDLYIPAPVFDTSLNHWEMLMKDIRKNLWIVYLALGWDLLTLALVLISPKKKTTMSDLSSKARNRGIFCLGLSAGISILGMSVISEISLFGLSLKGSFMWVAYFILVIGGNIFAIAYLSRSKLSLKNLWISVAVMIVLGFTLDTMTNITGFSADLYYKLGTEKIQENWETLSKTKEAVWNKAFETKFADFQTKAAIWTDAAAVEVGGSKAKVSNPGISSTQAKVAADQAFRNFENALIEIEQMKLPEAPSSQNPEKAEELFNQFLRKLGKDDVVWAPLPQRAGTSLRAITEAPMKAAAGAGLTLLGILSLVISWILKRRGTGPVVSPILRSREDRI